MSRGRGSAIAAVVLPILCLLLAGKLAIAAEYTVGDAGGWRFNVVDWPNGKSFKAGDVLAFNYNPQFHNVVVLSDEGAYTGCQTPSGSKVVQTGSDKLTLAKGKNYFICNFPGHCEGNMKIAVDAE